MRTRLFLFSAITSVLFISCSLEGSIDNTPQMELFCYNLSAKDTLNGYYTDEANTYRLDTIQEGDTLQFRISLIGFYNNLTNYYMQVSDTTLSKVILPSTESLDTVFNSISSNYDQGKFIFLTNINNCYFPFKYVAKKTGNPTLQFMLVSDANFENSYGYNSSTFKITTPIIAIKTED